MMDTIRRTGTAGGHGTAAASGAVGWRAGSGRRELDAVDAVDAAAGEGVVRDITGRHRSAGRMPSDDARSAIVGATRRCFAEFGFRGTSLADIAREYGGSKAALLYHFASKDEILLEIVRPLWSSMEALAAWLRTIPDAAAARDAAVRGMVDIAVTHRSDVALLYGEIPRLLAQEAFESYRDASNTILDALSLRAGTEESRILAVVVVSGVANACHEFHDIDAGTLRAALETAYRRAFPVAPCGDPD